MILNSIYGLPVLSHQAGTTSAIKRYWVCYVICMKIVKNGFSFVPVLEQIDTVMPLVNSYNHPVLYMNKQFFL